MDGLIEFVLFVGFIGFCIFIDKLNGAVKKVQNEAPSKPVVINIPLPQQMSHQPSHQKNAAKKIQKVNNGLSSFQQSKDMSQRMEFQNEGIRSTESTIQLIEPQQHSEYEMNTAEDIRKAIVWSEVLKRKY